MSALDRLIAKAREANKELTALEGGMSRIDAGTSRSGGLSGAVRRAADGEFSDAGM